jgi:hypothetical protein
MKQNKTGHPLFEELTKDELALHEAKNKDYRSDTDPLANFKRVAAWMALYPKMNWAQPELVAAIYAQKQNDAYMSLMERGVEGGLENCDTRLQDDHIYKKIMRILHKER